MMSFELAQFSRSAPARSKRQQMLYEACKLKSPAQASQCLDRGCDPFYYNSDGMASVHIACYHNSARVLRVLLQRVPQLKHYCTQANVHPLQLAANRGNMDAIQVFQAFHVDINMLVHGRSVDYWIVRSTSLSQQRKVDCLTRLYQMGFNFSCGPHNLIGAMIALDLPAAMAQQVITYGAPVTQELLERSISFHNHLMLQMLLDHLFPPALLADHAIDHSSGKCLDALATQGCIVDKNHLAVVHQKDAVTFGRLNCALLVESVELSHVKRRAFLCHLVCD